MKILNNLPNPEAPTGPRPDGALKDVSAPAAGDGTPSRADWHNDHYYALLAIMDNVGISADDSDEELESGSGVSQFLDAMRLFVQENAYPGLDFGLKNISGGNQASDITIYEAGGGSEKEDGFTVRLRWTGGDGTFAHTITAANTIGNEMAGFLASSAWQGDGAGELVLRLDKTNSKWLVLTPGVWDSGNFTEGDWEKYINRALKQYGIDDLTVAAASSGGQVITFPVPWIDTNYRTIAILNGIVGGGLWMQFAEDTRTTTTANERFCDRDTENSRTGTTEFRYIANGFWA